MISICVAYIVEWDSWDWFTHYSWLSMFVKRPVSTCCCRFFGIPWLFALKSSNWTLGSSPAGLVFLELFMGEKYCNHLWCYVVGWVLYPANQHDLCSRISFNIFHIHICIYVHFHSIWWYVSISAASIFTWTWARMSPKDSQKASLEKSLFVPWLSFVKCQVMTFKIHAVERFRGPILN